VTLNASRDAGALNASRDAGALETPFKCLDCLTRSLPSDMAEGTVGDMAALGVTESFQVKRQVLLSASEAAEMILRVDNIIKAAPRSDLTPRAGRRLATAGCLLFVSVGRGFPTTTPVRGRGG